MLSSLISLLIGITTFFGIKNIPESGPHWKASSGWVKTEGGHLFSASSTEVVNECKQNPNFTLHLPQVIHGVHELYLDGKLISRSGDPTFKKASSFYSRPEITCALLSAGAELTWQVYSYSNYFSRFTTFPKVQSDLSAANFFDVNLNIIATGALFLLCLFSHYLFANRINTKAVNGISLGAIFFASYFAMTVSPEFSFQLPMLLAHKIADISLLIGSGFYFYVFYQFNYLKKQILYAVSTLLCLFAIIIALGKDGDVVQLGTSLSLPVIVFALFSVALTAMRATLLNRKNKQAWLSLTSTLIIVLSAGSDVLHIFGLTEAYMLLPIGAVAGVFLLALSANQQIERTYQERDELLNSLEKKVATKTQDLTAALENLKRSQAELVQSAKLASLGTLSAGVAHEINNSINFVNGAIAPLEKKVMNLAPEAEKANLQKLFSAIRHGTDLTVQIVRSLRSFTGLNQAQFREVSVEEVVNSVLTILKSKVRDIQLIKEIDPSVKVYGSQVGLSQILMNLISNALDVLPKSAAEISIKVYHCADMACIDIGDNGCGMPLEVQSRIFDPFYTTKDVGQGTGLGLYIVKKEVDKHQGKITVSSEPGKGSCFHIILPCKEYVTEPLEPRSAA